jgi:molybdate transport system substrate-binding protein
MSALRIALCSLLLLPAPWATAGEITAAVAANFAAPMKEISRAFTALTGHRAIVSHGSTGKLYAQVLHGAPFDVFLAADQRRPRLLAEAGKASVPFTYAVGRLVLWSADPGKIDPEGAVLTRGELDRLAIANPKTAPYGTAALQVLEALGVRHALEPKLVRGENIAQTYQFVLTGNATLGFVALAQVALDASGSRWEPPQGLYEPIRQDAVLLARGTGNPAASALLDFLRGPGGRAIIERYGYGVE